MRINLILALCASFLPLIRSSPSFCKCTCFTNSTIIPLSSYAPSLALDQTETRVPTVGCSTCNKAFCLSQRLPICKDAEEKDVNTICFQRDSRKDQVVVLTFIAGTLGLLGWAGIRKVLEKKNYGVRIDDVQDGYAAVRDS